MSDQLNTVLDNNQWATEYCPSRLTLAEFAERAHNYTNTIRSADDKLEVVNNLFTSGKRVWPSECENTIKCLTRVGEHSQRFHAFIERSAHLPLAIVSLRLPLLMTLKGMDKQITKLNQLLASMRDEGRTAVSQPIEQRHLIECELDALLLYSDEVFRETEQLLDRARFMERTYSMV